MSFGALVFAKEWYGEGHQATCMWPAYAAGAGTNGETPTGTQQVVAKLLVSNPIAGSVIGKVSQLYVFLLFIPTVPEQCVVVRRLVPTLSSYSAHQVPGFNFPALGSSTQVRLGSSSQLLFAGSFIRGPLPALLGSILHSMITNAGTSDRVLLLSGSLHSVLTAIFLILEKISRDANSSPGKALQRRSKPSDPDASDEVSVQVHMHLEAFDNMQASSGWLVCLLCSGSPASSLEPLLSVATHKVGDVPVITP